MPRRARALALGALGATVITTALAAATAVPTVTGCTTHQCDASSYDYYGGVMLDANTYATSLLNQKWIDYGPNTTVRIHFPNVGRAPSGLPLVYVGTGDEPNGGPDYMFPQNETPASGQLALVNFLDSNGVWVTNGSCATYVAYLQVTFVPPALALFGGAMTPEGAVPFGDTYTWSGAGWTARTTAAAPPAATAPPSRIRPVMGTVNERVYMFGGLASTGAGTMPLQDTWSWDGVTWAQAFPLQAPPAPRYDAASGMAVARDSNGNLSTQLVMFGGRGADGSVLGDMWAWDGTLWTQQPLPPSDGDAGADAGPPPAPPARAGAAAAGLHGDLVLFGGTSRGGAPLSDTWVWHDSRWTLVLTDPADGTGPAARTHAAAASLPGHVLLFGGAGASGDFGDTWLWNGAAWTRAMPPSSPSPRSSATMGVYSLAPETAVLFGGFTNSTPLGDTWTWDDAASTWTDWNMQPLGPTPRGAAVAASN